MSYRQLPEQSTRDLDMDQIQLFLLNSREEVVKIYRELLNVEIVSFNESV